MAELMKDSYGVDVAVRISRMIARVYPRFPVDAFLTDVRPGFSNLELMDRGRRIAGALHTHLPPPFAEAARILTASLGPTLEEEASTGLSSFLYLPHSFFVATHGLDDFEAAMAFQYELTQRFTAEFCIRPYLEHHPEKTLARLRLWVTDSSEHVRRLVSEGTRPRLPWAGRLRGFQKNPQPVLDLLESLKDDPALYVRRSVANNLNDIGKDHPQTLLATTRRWMIDAPKPRQWIVRRALRSLIKEGNPAALALIGCRPSKNLSSSDARVSPSRVRQGASVVLNFQVTNSGPRSAKATIDFRVHYVKANGKTSPKVFKLATVDLPPLTCIPLEKSLSLKDLTTRRHHPGHHHIEALINGTSHPLGSFILLP
ncbi:MAG: hypothetical protein WEB60_05485 [Terrimicrobiaceae bacterium]